MTAFVPISETHKACPLCGQTATLAAKEPVRHSCADQRLLRGMGTAAPAAKMPSPVRRAWSFVKALGAFVAKPGLVPYWEYNRRLSICDTCDRRDGERCGECGCKIALKAKATAWHCPLSKWPGEANYVPDYLVDAGDRGVFDVVPCGPGEWLYSSPDAEVQLCFACQGWTCGLWFRDPSGAECRACYWEEADGSVWPLVLARFSDPTSAADESLPETVTIEPVPA